MRLSLRQTFLTIFTIGVCVANVESEAQSSFAIQKWIGPSYPTQSNINVWVASAMSGSKTATGWTYIPDGEPVNIISIFNSNGVGGSLYYTLSVTGTNTTLGQTLVTYSSLSPYAMTYDQAGVSYSGQGVGVSTNGTQYWTGNADSPVSAFYVLGASTGIEIGSENPVQAAPHWAPYIESASYAGNWGSVSITNKYVVQAALLNPQQTGTNFQFSFSSLQRSTYVVESCTNLLIGAWNSRTNLTGDGTVKTIQLPLSTRTTEFFRVETQ
jgi:hypothetical protein